MVALAVGTVAHAPSATLVAGAIAFAVSDLSVARDRFITKGVVNKLWGLPLYFGAQLLIASSAG
jgi:hypothetical protein